jgi:hypothetical protein
MKRRMQFRALEILDFAYHRIRWLPLGWACDAYDEFLTGAKR